MVSSKRRLLGFFECGLGRFHWNLELLYRVFANPTGGTNRYRSWPF